VSLLDKIRNSRHGIQERAAALGTHLNGITQCNRGGAARS